MYEIQINTLFTLHFKSGDKALVKKKRKKINVGWLYGFFFLYLF